MSAAPIRGLMYRWRPPWQTAFDAALEILGAALVAAVFLYCLCGVDP